MPKRLTDKDKLKLDSIVQEMTTNGEAESDIQFVVNDFKNIYGVDDAVAPQKKKDTPTAVGSASLGGGTASFTQSTKTAQGSGSSPSKGSYFDELRRLGKNITAVSNLFSENPRLEEDRAIAIQEAKDRYKRTPRILKPNIPEEKVDEIIANRISREPDGKMMFELTRKDRDEKLSNSGLREIEYEDAEAAVIYNNDKIELAKYRQNKSGKVASVLNKIKKGESVSQDDWNYFSSNAPKAKDELISFVASKVPIDKEHPQEALVSYFSNTNKQLQQKYYIGNLDKSLSQLQSNGIDVSKINDVKYQEAVKENVTKLYDERKKALEAKYPYDAQKEGLTSVRGKVHPQFNTRPQQFNDELDKLNQDYAQFNDLLGYAVATDYAKKNPTASPEEIGLEHLRVSNPDRYKMFKIVGGGESDAVKAEVAQYGIQALKSTGNQSAYDLADVDEKNFNDKYPQEKINEIYHRLGAELYKGENKIGLPSVKELDKIADTQLSQENRDFYYKYVRPRELKNVLGSNVPQQGFVTKFGESFFGTLEEAGKFLDFTRTDKERANEQLEGQPTGRQGVGEYQLGQQRLSQLKDKVKEGKRLTHEEILEMGDLESFVGVKTKVDDIIDKIGTTTGQVTAMAVGTKGLGGFLAKGVGELGLLKKAVDARKVLSLEESFASATEGIGLLTEQNIYSITANAIAYSSSYDQAKKQAIELMPDASEEKQTAFATAVGIFNVITERMFKDEKILDALKKEIKTDVAKIFSNLTDDEIKNLSKSELMNILKKTPTFSKYYAKNIHEESFEELTTETLTSVAKLASAPDKFNFKDELVNALTTYADMAVGGVFIGGMGALSDTRNSMITSPMISRIGYDENLRGQLKDLIRTQQAEGKITEKEAIGKMKIINTIEDIHNTTIPLANQIRSLSKKENDKVAVLTLQEKILKNNLKDEAYSELKPQIEKKILDIQKERNGILDKELIVNDDYTLTTVDDYNKKLQEEALNTKPSFLIVEENDGTFSIVVNNEKKESFPTKQQASDRVVELYNETQNNAATDTKTQSAESTTINGQNIVPETEAQNNEDVTTVEIGKPVEAKLNGESVTVEKTEDGYTYTTNGIVVDVTNEEHQANIDDKSIEMPVAEVGGKEVTPPTSESSTPATETAPIGEPTISKVDDGDLYEFKTENGLVGGVLISPTEFRIDGISANETGKGKGTKMFEGLISYLKEKGVTTISTISAGEGAKTMHQKAVDKGLISKVSEDGRNATFTINNKTAPTVEVKTEPVTDLVGKKVEFKGQTGTVVKDEGGKLSFVNDNEKGYDYDLTPEDVATEIVEPEPLAVKLEGNNVTIGDEMFEFVSNNLDNDGNVVSVTLKNSEGRTITKRDPDLAIEIGIQKNNQEFDNNTYTPEEQQQIVTEVNNAVTAELGSVDGMAVGLLEDIPDVVDNTLTAMRNDIQAIAPDEMQLMMAETNQWIEDTKDKARKSKASKKEKQEVILALDKLKNKLVKYYEKVEKQRVAQNAATAKAEAAKGDGESKQDTKPAEASATESAATEANVETPVAETKKSKKLKKLAEKLAESLKASGVKVEVVEGEEGKKEAQKRGVSDAEGAFIAEDGTVLLFADNISDEFMETIAYHEGSHPVVNIIRNTNPKLYKKLVSGLNRLLKAEEMAYKKAVEEAKKSGKPFDEERLKRQFKVMSAKRFSEQYKEEGAVTEEDEFLVETIARIGTGEIKLSSIPPSLIDSIIDFINTAAKVLGIDAKILNRNDYVQFKKTAEAVSTALKTGGDISKVVGKDNVKMYDAPIGNPSQLRNPESVIGEKVTINSDKNNLSLITKADLFDMESLLNDIYKKKQKVWFWMADQLGKGDYVDPVTKKKYHLDAGVSFPFDEENKNNGDIWASGADAKTIQGKITDSDYLFLVSGSPILSKMFNETVFDIVSDRIGDFKSFKKKALSLSNNKIFDKELIGYNSIEELKGNRKNFLIQLNEAANMAKSPLSVYLKSKKLDFDYNELRDGFLKGNNFKILDVMLVLKPSSVSEGTANHSTYKNAIKGEIVGIPNIKVNAWDIMPDNVRDYASRNIIPKPNQQLSAVAPYSGKIHDIQMSKGVRDTKGGISKADEVGLTKSDDGDFLFFHYGNIKGDTIDASKGTKKAYTTDKRRNTPNYYYTNTKSRENVVSGDGYVVKVSPDKVYNFNKDVLNLSKQAEANFRKDFPKGAFGASQQMDYMLPLIRKAGFDMTIAKWEGKYRAETTTPLKYDKKLTSDFNKYGSLDKQAKADAAGLAIVNKISSVANSPKGQSSGVGERYYSKNWTADTILKDPLLSKYIPSSLSEQYNNLKAKGGVQKSGGNRDKISEGLLFANFSPNKVISGVNEDLVGLSESYKKKNGIRESTPRLVLSVSEKDAMKIADAYDSMKHDPENKKVKESFDALIKEIKQQADVLINAGYKFELSKADRSYASSADMVKDVRDNKHVFIDPSSENFGTTREFNKDNIGLQDSGYKDMNGNPLTNVEVIRAVHDIFGHAKFGVQFGAVGEENAWRTHMSMFSPLAQKALTTTTRGQNSWVNFGGHMRANGAVIKKGEKGYLSPTERPFAEQKIGLLPDWAEKNSYGDKVTIGGREIAPVNKYEFMGEDVYEIADGDAYYEAILNAKDSRSLESIPASERDGIQVHVKSADEYQKVSDNGGKLLISKDGLTGVMVESDGNIGSGFNHSDNKKKNALAPFLVAGIKMGARYTDAYDTYLPKYYSKFGFKASNRMKFDERFAEAGWNDSILNTKPDVVFMYYSGGDRATIENRIGDFPNYSKSDGAYIDDYDLGVETAKNSTGEKSSLIPSTIKPQKSAGNRESLPTTEEDIKRLEGTALSTGRLSLFDRWFWSVVNLDNRGMMKMTETAKPTTLFKIAELYGLGDANNKQVNTKLDAMKLVRKEMAREQKLLKSDAQKSKGNRESFIAEKKSIVEAAKKEGTYLKAPNGKDTNLTPDQWASVRTKNFKDWFGDWENKPKKSSKVVDINGEPRVMYHGTNAEFTEFDTSEEGVSGRKGGTWNAEYPDGYMFFTSNKKDAKFYGKIAMPLFLDIKYPEIRKVEKGDSLVIPFDDEGLAFEGDAIVTDGKDMVVGTDNNTQIKSATENNGEYSSNTGNIQQSKKQARSYSEIKQQNGKETKKDNQNAAEQQAPNEQANKSTDNSSEGVTKKPDLRGRTPKSRRKLKNPDYLKALSVDSLGDPYTYALQWFIKGGGYSAELLRKQYGGVNRGGNDFSGKKIKMPMGELRAKIDFLDKKGAKTVDRLGEIISGNYTDEMGVEADDSNDSQVFANIAEDIINSYTGKRGMVDYINDKYGQAQEQYQSEYEYLQSQFGDNIDKAIDLLSEFSDSELEALIGDKKAFFDSKEYQDYINNESDVPPQFSKKGAREFSGDTVLNDYLNELDSIGKLEVNPFNRREYIYNGEANLEINRFDKKDRNEISLQDISVLDKSKGVGSRTMSDITKAADNLGYKITLEAKPFRNGGLDYKDLVSFYKKNGFVVDLTEYGGEFSTEKEMVDYASKYNESVPMYRDAVSSKKESPVSISDVKLKKTDDYANDGVYNVVTTDGAVIGSIYFDSASKTWREENYKQKAAWDVYGDIVGYNRAEAIETMVGRANSGNIQLSKKGREDIGVGGDVLEIINSEEKDGGVWNSAEFGRNGRITWEVPSSENKESPTYLIVQSIDRNKDTGIAPVEDSKGEGTKAIASLFYKYPTLKEIGYDDSANGFWQKIGGNEDNLKREDFFKYYNSKPTKKQKALQELKDAYNKLGTSGAMSDPIQDQRDVFNLIAKLINYARVNTIETVKDLIEKAKSELGITDEKLLNDWAAKAISLSKKEMSPRNKETLDKLIGQVKNGEKFNEKYPPTFDGLKDYFADTFGTMSPQFIDYINSAIPKKKAPKQPIDREAIRKRIIGHNFMIPTGKEGALSFVQNLINNNLTTGKTKKYSKTSIAGMEQEARNFIYEIGFENLMEYYKFGELPSNSRKLEKMQEINEYTHSNDAPILATMLTMLQTVPDLNLSVTKTNKYSSYLTNLIKATSVRAGQALNAYKIQQLMSFQNIDNAIEGFHTSTQEEILNGVNGEEGVYDVYQDVVNESDVEFTDSDMTPTSEVEKEDKIASDAELVTKIVNADKEYNVAKVRYEESRKDFEKIKQDIEELIKKCK
jgi:hypothetical protein